MGGGDRLYRVLAQIDARRFVPSSEGHHPHIKSLFGCRGVFRQWSARQGTAGMSTLSSMLNSVGTVTLEDVWQLHFSDGASEQVWIRHARGAGRLDSRHGRFGNLVVVVLQHRNRHDVPCRIRQQSVCIGGHELDDITYEVLRGSRATKQQA